MINRSGLGRSQLDIIRWLSKRQAWSPGDGAPYIQSRMEKLLAGLYRRGLVCAFEATRDGTIKKTYSLTDAGRDLMRRAL